MKPSHMTDSELVFTNLYRFFSGSSEFRKELVKRQIRSDLTFSKYCYKYSLKKLKIEPEQFRHLTDSELLKVNIQSSSQIIKFLKELQLRGNISTPGHFYKSRKELS
jgi:hypothetical protein